MAYTTFKTGCFIVYALTGLALSAPALSAKSVTLDINGKVTSPTCSIKINGLTAASVKLPEVKVSDFARPIGSISTVSETFTLELSNCGDVTVNSVGAQISRPVGTYINDEHIPQTSGEAKGIGFRIAQEESAGSYSGVSFSSPSSSTIIFDKLTSGSASKNINVAYMKTGTAMRPGATNSSITVDLVYR